mgnify:CR=1 FL=1
MKNPTKDDIVKILSRVRSAYTSGIVPSAITTAIYITEYAAFKEIINKWHDYHKTQYTEMEPSMPASVSSLIHSCYGAFDSFRAQVPTATPNDFYKFIEDGADYILELISSKKTSANDESEDEDPVGAGYSGLFMFD